MDGIRCIFKKDGEMLRYYNSRPGRLWTSQAVLLQPFILKQL